jgi:hypothetical protein
MVDEITASLMDAIESLKKQAPSRENALAITKAEEALMWWGQAQRKAMESAAGF